jgi:hypothetical protein
MFDFGRRGLGVVEVEFEDLEDREVNLLRQHFCTMIQVINLVPVVQRYMSGDSFTGVIFI